MTETSVTKKGQITIPIDIRKRFDITEGSKVDVTVVNGQIIIKKSVSILDLAGTGHSTSTPTDTKTILDQMRDEDA